MATYSSGRSLHLIISQLRNDVIVCHRTVRTMFGELNVSLSSVKKRIIVRRTVRTMFGELKVSLSSVKKRIIVRRTVRTMFGELTVRPVKNGL